MLLWLSGSQSPLDVPDSNESFSFDIYNFITHIFGNLYNDYFDVTSGTDEENNEYFNVGDKSVILRGAQISGGSRAIELGLIKVPCFIYSYKDIIPYSLRDNVEVTSTKIIENFLLSKIYIW